MPLQGSVDKSTLAEFANLWFHAGFQSYQAEVLRAALALAGEVGCEPSVLNELETLTSLFAFLHGDVDSVLSTTGGIS